MNLLQSWSLMPLQHQSKKVPLGMRTQCLAKLHEEFMKHNIDPSFATTMACNEELALVNRSQSVAGYSSSLAGALRGIREKQFTLPSTVAASNAPLPTVTEQMSKKNDGGLCNERLFYDTLRTRYLMTDDQLKTNGYPLRVKDPTTNEKKIIIESSRGDSKMFSEDNGEWH